MGLNILYLLHKKDKPNIRDIIYMSHILPLRFTAFGIVITTNL